MSISINTILPLLNSFQTVIRILNEILYWLECAFIYYIKNMYTYILHGKNQCNNIFKIIFTRCDMSYWMVLPDFQLHCQLSVRLETFYQKNALIINTFCLSSYNTLKCRLRQRNVLQLPFIVETKKYFKIEISLSSTIKT